MELEEEIKVEEEAKSYLGKAVDWVKAHPKTVLIAIAVIVLIRIL